jgi:geranylgeranyl diphosphate synthase type II
MEPHDRVVVTRHRQEMVDTVLDGFFRAAELRAAAIGERYVTLWKTLEQNTRGGKRFRPSLVFAAYEAFGGTDSSQAAHVGAAFELLHTALIVHDDVIDRDFIRRGGPNVSGSYRDRAQTAGIRVPTAEHRGMSVAIIAGDLALFNAFRLVDQAGIEAVTRRRIHDILDEAMFSSAAGELLDVDFSLHTEVPPVDEIVDMERLKTAVYSFESPLEAGAVLAGADDEAVRMLGRFGRSLGIAYQIVDDVLGVFGAERDTGKTTIGDLREGKRTVLMAYASRTPEWSEIAPQLGDPELAEDGAARIRSALVASGARSFAEALARDFANRAWEALASKALPDVVREEFRPLMAAVLERVK